MGRFHVRGMWRIKEAGGKRRKGWRGEEDKKVQGKSVVVYSGRRRK